VIKRALATLLCLSALTACAVTPAEKAENDKHKPALPSIRIYDGDGVHYGDVNRHCDGTTLVYRDEWKGGLAVVPNSPLCGAK